MPTNALFAKVRYDSRRARPFSRLRHNLKLGFYHISDDTVVVYFKNTPQITERGYIEFDLIIKIGEEFKFLNRIFRLETTFQDVPFRNSSSRASKNCLTIYILTEILGILRKMVTQPVYKSFFFTIGCASPIVSPLSGRVVRIVPLD